MGSVHALLANEIAGTIFGLSESKGGWDIDNPRRSYMPRSAKAGGRKYGKAASTSVESAVHREKRGTLKSGKGGKGGTVKSRKQAIAIGLSEARKKGAKVPRKKSS